MLLRVKYDEARYDMVKETALDKLIEAADITGFYRSGGWATIGCHPIRIRPGASYGGVERRRALLEVRPAA